MPFATDAFHEIIEGLLQLGLDDFGNGLVRMFMELLLTARGNDRP
jgi:hypothetical protein